MGRRVTFSLRYEFLRKLGTTYSVLIYRYLLQILSPGNQRNDLSITGLGNTTSFFDDGATRDPPAPALEDELFRAHDEQVSQPLPVSTTTDSLPAATTGTTRAHGTRANVKKNLSPLTSISLEAAASSSDGTTSPSPSRTPTVEDTPLSLSKRRRRKGYLRHGRPR